MPRLHELGGLEPISPMILKSTRCVQWLYEAMQQNGAYGLVLRPLAPYGGEFTVGNYVFEHKYQWWSWIDNKQTISFPGTNSAGQDEETLTTRFVFHPEVPWQYIFAKTLIQLTPYAYRGIMCHRSGGLIQKYLIPTTFSVVQSMC